MADITINVKYPQKLSTPYLFGSTVIYNPWSVIKFIENVKSGSPNEPRGHWGNTSRNEIVKELAARGSAGVKEKVEALVRGETITFELADHIAYSEITYQDDNVFNVLLNTGYLTASAVDGNRIAARIPNREVETIFKTQIRDWFGSYVNNVFDVQGMYQAIRRGGSEGAAALQGILKKEILPAVSYYDTVEAFYHGILLTLLASNREYVVSSNRESGNGRFDVESKMRYDLDDAVVLEVKVASSMIQMPSLAAEAAEQIERMKYVTDLLREGYERIYTYGIAFFGKTCRVCAGKIYTQADLDRLLLYQNESEA